jgi:hypothetical protein
MKKIWYVAGSLLLCGAMAFAQDATTTNNSNNNGNVTKAPDGTTVTQTKRDTIVMPKKKVVHTRKNTVKGGSKKVAAAPSDLGRGGKAIGHNMKGGHPVAAGQAGVEGGKEFGKKVGSGTKSAAVGVKDKVGSGLSAVGNKLDGKDKDKDKTNDQNPK